MVGGARLYGRGRLFDVWSSQRPTGALTSASALRAQMFVMSPVITTHHLLPGPTRPQIDNEDDKTRWLRSSPQPQDSSNDYFGYPGTKPKIQHPGRRFPRIGSIQMRQSPAGGALQEEMERLHEALERAARFEGEAEALEQQPQAMPSHSSPPRTVVTTEPALLLIPSNAAVPWSVALLVAVVFGGLFARCFFLRRRAAHKSMAPAMGGAPAGLPDPELPDPAPAASLDGELVLELVLSEAGHRRLAEQAPMVCKRWAGAGLTERASRWRAQLLERREARGLVPLPPVESGAEPLHVHIDTASRASLGLRPAADTPMWGTNPTTPWYSA